MHVYIYMKVEGLAKFLAWQGVLYGVIYVTWNKHDYTVCANKKETGIVSYFSEKEEQFIVNDIYHFKVQLFFFLLTPFMRRKSHA